MPSLPPCSMPTEAPPSLPGSVHSRLRGHGVVRQECPPHGGVQPRLDPSLLPHLGHPEAPRHQPPGALLGRRRGWEQRRAISRDFGWPDEQNRAAMIPAPACASAEDHCSQLLAQGKGGAIPLRAGLPTLWVPTPSQHRMQEPRSTRGGRGSLRSLGG